MQLPQKHSKAFALIQAMPKDGSGIARSHFGALMVSAGFDPRTVDMARTRLSRLGYLVEFGATFRLSDGILKHFRPKETAPVAVPAPSKPLSAKHIPFANPLLKDRLREWHPLTCAARPMPLEG